MRRDIQIGVILGVVILGIIAVFLSTRTSVDKQVADEQIKEEIDEGGRLEKKEVGQQLISPVEEFEDDAVIEGTLEGEVKETTETTTLTEKEETKEKVEAGFSVATEETAMLSDLTEKKEVDTGTDMETTKGRDGVKIVSEVVKEAPEEVSVELPVTHKKIAKDLVHKVGTNDNLFTLAKRYYGDPKKWLKIYNANVDVIYDRNSLPIGKELIIPDVEVFDAEPSKEPSSLLLPKKSGDGKTHVVKQGDTLYKLSRLYYGNTESWILIYNANKTQIGSNNTLYVGQELVIPETKALAKTAVKGGDLPPLRSEQAVTAVKERDFRTYEVKKGDTLFKIAKQFYNDETKWRKIYEANKEIIPDSNSIQPGRVIIIPQ